MTTLTMLVVDDEYMILEGMKQLLPYADYGIGQLETAESAEEALDYIREHPVDIVLTDVSMPDMTGLEMVAQMKEISPETSVIIMSGFQEFEYAKKAISLGALDYLVKPINKKELAQLLERTVAEKSKGQDPYQLWRDVIRGREPISSLLSADQPTYLVASSAAMENQVTVERTVGHQSYYFYFSSTKPEVADFAPLLDETSQMETLIDQLERQAFYGHITQDLSATARESYQELLPYLETGQIHRLEEQLPSTVEELRSAAPAVYLTKQLFNQIMTDVYHHFKQLERSRLEDYFLEIEACQDLESLLAITLGHLHDIRERHQYSHHVEEILDIIQREYQTELTLKEVSERLYLNTVYLGQIIKKETGATFAELLNRKRIKMAQQLLVTSDDGIEDICFQVGYTNIGYFYKIFKRFCGESPKSYRQKMGYLSLEKKKN